LIHPAPGWVGVFKYVLFGWQIEFRADAIDDHADAGGLFYGVYGDYIWQCPRIDRIYLDNITFITIFVMLHG